MFVEKVIFNNHEFPIFDRCLIIGDNGAGKSQILKAIAGENASRDFINIVFKMTPDLILMKKQFIDLLDITFQIRKLGTDRIYEAVCQFGLDFMIPKLHSGLDIRKLSWGQRALLNFVILSVRQQESKDVLLLIDEVETHLNPKWQRWIMMNLSNLFPNTKQIIMTSHSPYVIDFFKDKEVIDLNQL